MSCKPPILGMGNAMLEHIVESVERRLQRNVAEPEKRALLESIYKKVQAVLDKREADSKNHKNRVGKKI